MRSVVLTEAPEQDISAAAFWYESEVAGLGRQFLDAVNMTLERIEFNPVLSIYSIDARHASSRQ
jgi:hypothetical protein